MASQGMFRYDEVWQVRLGKVGLVVALYGMAGKVWLGIARCGLLWQARCVKVRYVMARQG